MSIDRGLERTSQITIGSKDINLNGCLRDAGYKRYFEKEHAAFLEEREITAKSLRELSEVHLLLDDYNQFDHTVDARDGDIVQMHTQLEEIYGDAIVFNQRMNSGDDTLLVCVAKPRLVVLRVGSNEKIQLPKFLSNALESYVAPYKF